MESSAYFSHDQVSFIYLFTCKLKVKIVLVLALKALSRSLHIQPIILNPLNAELNPICHLLALLGGATIVVVSRLRVNLGNRERWVVRLTLRPALHLRKKLPYTRWIAGLFGSRTCPDVLEKKKTLTLSFSEASCLLARIHHTNCTVKYPTVSAISNRWSYFRVFQLTP